LSKEKGGADGGDTFELHLSMQGTDLYDSFRIAVPSRHADATLIDLIELVFPEDVQAFNDNYAGLDVKSNPDLPDIYLALWEILGIWRSGECALHFFGTSGSEIEPSQSVKSYFGSEDSSLVLVMEQSFDVLTHFEERGGNRDELLHWLQGMTLLYFVDKHGFQLRSDRGDEADAEVLSIASDLQSRGILSLPEPTGAFEITEEGRRTLGDMIAETESYIDQFDLFKDVTYDADADLVEFDTGFGEDFRVQVYDAERLDIYRTVFLLRMYDGTLDEYSGTWTEQIGSEDFFNEILQPVLDRDHVDDESIDWIIDSGFAHNEELLEANRERQSQQEIIRRVRSD
jgi:hypothetical protein